MSLKASDSYPFEAECVSQLVRNSWMIFNISRLTLFLAGVSERRGWCIEGKEDLTSAKRAPTALTFTQWVLIHDTKCTVATWLKLLGLPP